VRNAEQGELKQPGCLYDGVLSWRNRYEEGIGDEKCVADKTA